MDLFVYSDESGVFDRIHNDFFVFGGLLLIGKDAKDVASRKYIAAEKAINSTKKYQDGYELKATHITSKEKAKLFRSLNAYYKFAVVVNQKSLNAHIFDYKKSKQRYLDYAYKIGLKQLLKYLKNSNLLPLNELGTLRIFADEHTTATDGRYELQEALLQEYKLGTFNFNYNTYFSPILPQLIGVETKYCNSATTTLVRAADIIANKVEIQRLQVYIDKLKDILDKNDIEYPEI